MLLYWLHCVTGATTPCGFFQLQSDKASVFFLPSRFSPIYGCSYYFCFSRPFRRNYSGPVRTWLVSFHPVCLLYSSFIMRRAIWYMHLNHTVCALAVLQTPFNPFLRYTPLAIRLEAFKLLLRHLGTHQALSIFSTAFPE